MNSHKVVMQLSGLITTASKTWDDAKSASLGLKGGCRCKRPVNSRATRRNAFNVRLSLRRSARTGWTNDALKTLPDRHIAINHIFFCFNFCCLKIVGGFWEASAQNYHTMLTTNNNKNKCTFRGVSWNVFSTNWIVWRWELRKIRQRRTFHRHHAHALATATSIKACHQIC